MSHVLGIDLGTTNSCCAIYENGKETVIINAEGGRTTPSVISFSDGRFQVGEEAKNAEESNPGSSISSVKRHMGKDVIFNVGDKEIDATTVSALILEKIKNDAESYLGEEIKSAVITVPAYFDEVQRQATINAAKLAQLNVLRILNEPSAAAIAYGVNKKHENANILVFDFGGGTLDVSVVNISNNNIQVISTSGINDLGGDSIDEALADRIISDFYDENDINLKEDRSAYIRIVRACENAKKALTTKDTYQINIPYIVQNPNLHINTTITRELLENISSYLLKNIKTPIKQAVEDAGITFEDLSEVIMVGGSSRMPIVQQIVKDITGKEPLKTINPDEAVAIGAAIQGDIMNGGTSIVFSDITSLSLSIGTVSGLVNVLIPRNTPIPCSVTKTFKTGLDYQTDVKIDIFQGERVSGIDNTALDSFVLYGITPAKKGVVTVDVTFTIDESGILHVKAIENGTENSKEVNVQNTYALSAKEIENKLNLSEYFKKADAEKVRLTELKYRCKEISESLDSLLNSDIDLTDEEYARIIGFQEILSDFLSKSNPTDEEIQDTIGKNAIIIEIVNILKERKEV